MSAQFAGQRIVVMGLGRFGGGVGVSQWLAGQGARVLVTDQADAASLAGSVAQLDGLGVTFRLGRHDEADLDGADLLVVSPAVDRKKSPFVQTAVRRGIPISSEMNLFLERCAGRVIGITGTVGKSTTAAMLHAILTLAASRGQLGTSRVRLGGNIGQSLLGELDDIRAEDWVVLELSSFQLDDAGALRWSPPVALITNVTPNHLDRHSTFEEYLRCKLNVCRFQSRNGTIVLGTDDARVSQAVREISDQTGARVVHSSDDVNALLRVPGRHNRANADLAATAAQQLAACGTGILPVTSWAGSPCHGSSGALAQTITDALEQFNGLPHRLQFVAAVNGVRYYNDSKATTPGGVAVALESFDRPVILIAGGQEKEGSWTPVTALAPTRIKKAFCTGENGRRLSQTLGAMEMSTLAEAVAAAHCAAGEGDIVLFSPGSPSYDRYVNYEARGNTFVRLVRQLS